MNTLELTLTLLNSKVLETKGNKDVYLTMNSTKDKLYEAIKDFNFDYLLNYLNDNLTDIGNVFENKNNISAEYLTEHSNYLDKFNSVCYEYKQVGIHINIADYLKSFFDSPLNQEYILYEKSILINSSGNEIVEFYEKEFGKQSDMVRILRIIMLDSLVSNGISSELYETIKRSIINAYGPKEIFLLRNLETFKILKKKEFRSHYGYIYENLGLLNPSVNLSNPDDPLISWEGIALYLLG